MTLDLTSHPDASQTWLPSQPARQLFVLLRGTDQDSVDLTPLAESLHASFPQAAIVMAPAFAGLDEGLGEPSDCDPQILTQVLAALVPYVQGWQTRLSLTGEGTALAGFSQGAMLALEAVKAQSDLAGRVMAFSGRYTELPQQAPPRTTIHLLHGARDEVVPVTHAQAAQARLGEIHGDATIDIASSVGHVLHPALIQQSIIRLQTCVPLRSWEAALGGDPGSADGSTVH